MFWYNVVIFRTKKRHSNFVLSVGVASKLFHRIMENNVLEPFVNVHVLWQWKLDGWTVALAVQGVVYGILKLLILVHRLWVIRLGRRSQSAWANMSNNQTLVRNARHFANVSEHLWNPPLLNSFFIYIFCSDSCFLCFHICNKRTFRMFGMCSPTMHAFHNRISFCNLCKIL